MSLGAVTRESDDYRVIGIAARERKELDLYTLSRGIVIRQELRRSAQSVGEKRSESNRVAPRAIEIFNCRQSRRLFDS